MPRRLAIVLAAGLVALAHASPASAAGHAASEVTPERVCEVVRSEPIAIAADVIVKLLPVGTSLKSALNIVFGAAAKLCHLWAPTAVAVGQRVVKTLREQIVGAASSPFVLTPFVSLLAGRTIDHSGAAPVLVYWAGTGVDHFEGQSIVNQRFFGAVQVPAGAPRVWVTASPESVNTYRVRGVTTSGYAGAWRPSATFKVETIDARLVGSGWNIDWRVSDGYLGTESYTRQQGAQATFTFTGFSVGIAAPYFPQGGVADIYVDGRPARRINLYQPAIHHRAIVFTWVWPFTDRHVITIRQVSGEIDIDAFLVLSPA